MATTGATGAWYLYYDTDYGDTPESCSIFVQEDDSGESASYAFYDAELPTLSQYGFSFLGWYLEDGTQVVAGETYEFTGECVALQTVFLYAKWELNLTTIEETTLRGLGDAVRGLTGKSDTMTPAEMIEQVGQEIIKFGISVSGGVNYYYCFQGMTWREFAQSAFNHGSLVTADSDVVYNSYPLTDISGDDVISATQYTAYVCCFVAGTQVLISLDGETKNIEDIREGDTVVSYNSETGENYLAAVPGVVINEQSTRMAHVVFANGTVLEMTDYHPIYTTDGFKSITDPKYEKLVVGDTAKTADGWSEITSIVQYTLAEPIWTYTLKVSDIGESPDDDTNDNYYANGIVVHNAGCSGDDM